MSRHDLPIDDLFVSMIFEKHTTNNISLDLSQLDNIMSLLGIMSNHSDSTQQNHSLVYLFFKIFKKLITFFINFCFVFESVIHQTISLIYTMSQWRQALIRQYSSE